MKIRSNPIARTGTKSHGFTIVELIVVIVIIAILAAITTIAFQGVQKRAHTSALQSDLTQSTKLLAKDYALNGAYPTDHTQAGGGQGLPSSNGATLYNYTSDGTSYCLTAARAIEGVLPYHTSSSNQINVEGLCPGHDNPASSEEVGGGTGETWTAHAAEANGWQAVTYGNGTFVAVGSTGANRAMTSTNGSSWITHPVPALNTWISVTFGDGKFVAVTNGTSATQSVMTSSNGIEWTLRSAHARNWQSVTHGNGKFVAVGDNNAMVSNDGVTWTTAAGVPPGYWSAVTYGNGKFVAVSRTGENKRVMTSTDGVSWTAHDAPEERWWWSIAFGNGKFVVLARDTSKRAMSSVDGVNWTTHDTKHNNARALAFSNGRFVAVGGNSNNNAVMTSTDGASWSLHSAADSGWYGITYGSGKFVAVKYSGATPVMTSP